MTKGRTFEHRYEEITSSALRDFASAEMSTGSACDFGKVRVNKTRAPHHPKGLPDRQDGRLLLLLSRASIKIGLAGPNSDARFRSHHYSAGRAMSTLAGSISKHPEKVGLKSIQLSQRATGLRKIQTGSTFSFPRNSGRICFPVLRVSFTRGGSQLLKAALPRVRRVRSIKTLYN